MSFCHQARAVGFLLLSNEAEDAQGLQVGHQRLRGASPQIKLVCLVQCTASCSFLLVRMSAARIIASK